MWRVGAPTNSLHTFHPASPIQTCTSSKPCTLTFTYTLIRTHTHTHTQDPHVDDVAAELDPRSLLELARAAGVTSRTNHNSISSATASVVGIGGEVSAGCQQLVVVVRSDGRCVHVAMIQQSASAASIPFPHVHPICTPCAYPPNLQPNPNPCPPAPQTTTPGSTPARGAATSRQPARPRAEDLPGWEMLLLSCRVAWPMNLVVPPRALARYQLIFRCGRRGVCVL